MPRPDPSEAGYCSRNWDAVRKRRPATCGGGQRTPAHISQIGTSRDLGRPLLRTGRVRQRFDGENRYRARVAANRKHALRFFPSKRGNNREGCRAQSDKVVGRVPTTPSSEFGFIEH